LISGNLSAAGGLLLGAFFIVMCSVFLGIITRGKKFFELFFCFLTYANLNGIPPLDYFASFPHSGIWFGVLAALTSALVAASFLVRQHQLQSD